jgi:hypothetical protein
MGQFDSMGLQPVGKIGLTSPKNRSSTFKRVENKPKPKTAASPASPTPPNKPPKDNSNKKEPAKDIKKKPPEDGMGALVRNRK